VRSTHGQDGAIVLYPANLSKPAFNESGRIQQLVRHLEGLEFVNRPMILKQREQRSFLEVFPSPAQVILFPTASRHSHFHGRALRYKCKKGRHKNKRDRSWVEVHSEWEIYWARLRSLGCRKPRMTFSPEVSSQIGIDIAGFEGAAYKQWDDLLDGVFCAYLAYYFYQHGEEGCWVMGDSETGSVTIPKCQMANCPLMQRLKEYAASMAS
jgi:predicted RNase H-like nuclease